MFVYKCGKIIEIKRTRVFYHFKSTKFKNFIDLEPD